MLLRGAALVVEPHNPIRLHRQVAAGEADAREQLARVPFDLGDNAARLLPGRCLILEILVEAFDLGQRRSPHGPGQPMRDPLSQDFVGRQPDSVEVACLFQSLIDRGDRVGGIGSEEPAA